MKYDEILQTLGDFGTYQKRFLIMAMCMSLGSGPTLLSSIFNLATPKHRCCIPEYANDTYVIQNTYHGQVINQSIPESSSCLLRNQTADEYGNVTSLDYKCASWVYDTSSFTSTIVTEFNLVCDSAVYQSTAVTAVFFGTFVGYAVVSGMADIIGRKPLMVGSNFIFISTWYLLIWSPTYWFIVCMRFLQGVSYAGQICSIYIIGLEIVGASKRIYSAVAAYFMWCSGVLIITGCSYCLRDWRDLQIVLAVFLTFILFYFLVIPESPRWLLTRGYNVRAKEIIIKMAKANKVELSEELLSNITVSDQVTRVKFWRMFTSYRLCFRTLVIYIAWFTCALTYFGVLLQLEELSGSVYVNLAATTMIEIIWYVVLILATDKFGRKKMVFGGFCMSVVSMMACIFIELYVSKDMKWVLTAVSIVGRSGIIIAFGVIWFWTGELFPTELRNTGMGSSSAVGRIGSIVAPYIGLMNKTIPGDFGRVSPLIVYSGVCLLSLILIGIVLPETSRIYLPETIDDCKRLEQRRQPAVVSDLDTSFSEDIGKNLFKKKTLTSAH